MQTIQNVMFQISLGILEGLFIILVGRWLLSKFDKKD